MSPIIRSGYATHTRTGSTRAYRRARAEALAGATLCHLCGQPFTDDDPAEADHVNAYADHGHGPLRPVHRTCNRQRGRTRGEG